MSVPTNVDFATDVKVDRLGVLWKVTVGLGSLLLFITIATAVIGRMNTVMGTLSAAVMIGVGFLVQFLLQRFGYNRAVWAFGIGYAVVIALPMIGGDTTIKQVMPFAYPILLFLFGLLVSPAQNIVMAFASTIVMVLAAQSGGTFTFDTYLLAAIALNIISVLLSLQVSGEIYAVTEWALGNYRNERAGNQKLFDSRHEVQRALKRAEVLAEELQSTNAELDQARGLAEEAKHFRGQFLANMSHELRTPLNAIIGFSDTMLNFPMMYDDVSLPPQYEADLRQIHNSGKSLLSLINDILDLAKVDAGKLEVHMQPLDLLPIFNSTVATAAGLIGPKPIKLEKDIPANLPKAFGDEARVRQVLLNLYSNAAKFTEKGTIKLTVRAIDDSIQISVTDSGSGIDAKDLGLIFEEFKQSSNAGRDPRAGAGLGLAICRQLLTLMGGRIWAESELGKGSTFSFAVQKYQEGMTAPTPETMQAQA
jgi:signal transduction histidine kinase